MNEEIKTRASLKAAFSTGMKPTQSDFADIFDSFVHKDDKVDVTSTTGIYSIEETDQLLSAVIAGEGNAVQFMQSINAISDAAAAAQQRADDAYTLAAHADGTESTGYAWANTANNRCQQLEGDVQQLTASVETAIITSNEAKATAQQNATTSQYGRVQLAANTGTGSDSGKVPVIGSNGKLNYNVLPELSETSQTWGVSGGSINIGANGNWYNVYNLTISSGTSLTVDINMPETLSAGAPHSITFELLLAGVGTMTFYFKCGNSTIHTVTETLTGSTKNRTIIAFISSGLKYRLTELTD